MMTGLVTADLEATLPLAVLYASGQPRPVTAVIDTGYNGFLTLPPGIIAALNHVWLCREEGILADGSIGLFDVYRAEVIWHGSPHAVEIEAVDAAPLLGMALLHGQELKVQVLYGGSV